MCHPSSSWMKWNELWVNKCDLSLSAAWVPSECRHRAAWLPPGCHRNPRLWPYLQIAMCVILIYIIRTDTSLLEQFSGILSLHRELSIKKMRPKTTIKLIHIIQLSLVCFKHNEYTRITNWNLYSSLSR